MYAGAASARGLTEAFERCEPTRVNRSFNNVDVGHVEVLLTPKDISRRRNGLWHLGRPKYSLGMGNQTQGPEIAAGIHAGSVAFPDKCAVCLGEATEGAVWELSGDLLPGGSGRYRARDRRVVVAANRQRIWYSVPFCSAHAKHPGGVAVGTTMMNRSWITFRNNEYGREFGDLNGLEARHFATRWWFMLAVLASLLLFLGIGVAASALADDNTGTVDFIAAIVLLALGIGLSVYLYRAAFVPWRAQRGSSGRESRVVGAHRDRGDGYCAHCHRPWPCQSAR